MKAAALAIGGLALSLARPAGANGRFPSANRIVLSRSDPNLVITRATYGIFPSFDYGSTWTFLCEDALGLPQNVPEDPALALTASNALVVGLWMPGGLNVSGDYGCNWSCIDGPIAGESVVDVAVRANAPHSVVALTSTPSADATTWHSQAFESSDDGARWTALGSAIDPSVLVTTVDVAPSDPHRLYVSGTRGFGPARTASIFVSYDSGNRWTEYGVPLDVLLESTIYIAGVDPTDADRVYVRTDHTSRLFVTLDGGKRFENVLTFAQAMEGFAISDDGSTIYAGGSQDGLFVGDRATLSFKKRSSRVIGHSSSAIDLHVKCLATRGSELWACADEPSGFIAGVSIDGGATFWPKLHLGTVGPPVPCGAHPSGPLACAADANASECAGDPFNQLCTNYGCADASAGPGSGVVTTISVTGGCSAASAGGASAFVGVGLGLALALRRRLANRARVRASG